MAVLRPTQASSCCKAIATIVRCSQAKLGSVWQSYFGQFMVCRCRTLNLSQAEVCAKVWHILMFLSGHELWAGALHARHHSRSCRVIGSHVSNVRTSLVPFALHFLTIWMDSHSQSTAPSPNQLINQYSRRSNPTLSCRMHSHCCNSSGRREAKDSALMPDT